MDYNQFIDNINSGAINKITFCVKGYAHYKNCTIERIVEVFRGKQIFLIRVKLTNDNSEMISFYGRFNEDEKIFKITGKGKFTLKQMWKDIQILTS